MLILDLCKAGSGNKFLFTPGQSFQMLQVAEAFDMGNAIFVEF